MAANNNLALRILIGAQDNASSVLDSLKNNAGKVAGAIAGYFSIKAFAGMVSDAAEFEAQMSKVQAVSGITGAELKKLETAAKDMGASTQYTATEAALALEELGKAGLSSAQAIEALPQVLALAQANGIELADAAGFITKAVNGMGLSFSDSARVADVLTAAAAAANTDVQGLGSAFSYAAPMANTLGLTMEELAAYIGKMSDAGIDASRSGTALNSVMSQFLDPASKFREELSKIGINTTDFNVAIVELAAKGKEGEAALLALGQEAGPGMRAVLNQGIPALQEFTQKLNDSKGAAAEAAKVMSDNFEGAMDGLSSSVDAIKLQLAQPILEPLQNALYWVIEKLKTLSESGLMDKVGAGISNAFAVAQKAVEDFSTVVIETVEKGKLAFDDLSNKIDQFTSSPAITALSSAFTAAFSAVVANINYVVDAFSTMWTRLESSPEIARFISAMQMAFTSAAKTVDSFLGTIADILGLFRDTATPTTFGNVLAATFEKVATVGSIVLNTLTTVIETVRAGFYGLSGAIATAMGGAIEAAAKVQEAIASITFGDFSERFKTLAKDSHSVAESFAASAEVNFGKAQTALDSAANSGMALRQSYIDLAVGAETTTQKVTETAGALDKTTESAGLTADQLDALGEGAQVADGKLVSMAAAATTADTELKKMPVSAADAAAAYKTLGVTSTAELQNLASAAGTAFQTIKNSGTASALDVRNAFQAYADKAIAANGGVVSATLKADAAASQLSVTVDATGKVIVKSFAAGGETAEELAAKINNAEAASVALAEQENQAAAARMQHSMNQQAQYEAESQAVADSFAQLSADLHAESQAIADSLTAAANAGIQSSYDQLDAYGAAWKEMADHQAGLAMMSTDAWQRADAVAHAYSGTLLSAIDYNNELTESVENFNQAGEGIGHTEAQLNAYIYSAEQALEQTDKLSSTTLSELTSSISAARSELQGMASDAASALSELSSLQNEYDSMLGNTAAVDNRNYEAKKKKIEGDINSTNSADAKNAGRQSLAVLAAIKAEKDRKRVEKEREEQQKEYEKLSTPKKLASGGPVRGPGSGTSDEIPAMLSNGEYVIPADSAKKVGEPFLNAIRNGKKPLALASGGMVGGASTKEWDKDLEYIKKEEQRVSSAIQHVKSNQELGVWMGYLSKLADEESSIKQKQKESEDQQKEIARIEANKKKDDEKNNPKKSASGESSSGGSDTMIVKFVSPTGQQVSGQFNKADATGILQIIKDAGMRTA